MHGLQRRDMIRRKVVEAKILREVEKMENGESETSHVKDY
jgi:hypothetical protein